MAQAGLHIPAEPGSALSPFAGDLRRHRRRAVHRAEPLHLLLAPDQHHRRSSTRPTARSLVLLDELGAGTDPAEGAALARALLDHFRARGRHDLRRHPLPGAQDLRAAHARRAQRHRRVRRRDAEPHLPADHRPAGPLERLRHRPAAGPAARRGRGGTRDWCRPTTCAPRTCWRISTGCASRPRQARDEASAARSEAERAGARAARAAGGHRDRSARRCSNRRGRRPRRSSRALRASCARCGGACRPQRRRWRQ